MTLPLLLASAVLMGFAGALHCIGMCGGIATALTFSLPEEKRRGPQLWHWQILFGTGRVMTYALLGAIAGLLGAGVIQVSDRLIGLPLLVAALLMVLLALHLLGKSAGIQWLERAGLVVWRRFQPLLRPLLPITSAPRALLLGMGWGLLPCGLVYSALALSVGAANPLGGALVMFVFGLVTIPPVAASGVIGGTTAAMRSPLGRGIAAGLAMAIAVVLVWQALSGGHDHGSHDHGEHNHEVQLHEQGHEHHQH